MNAPLAERLRPKKLTDYISQSHLIGPQRRTDASFKTGLDSLHDFLGPARHWKNNPCHDHRSKNLNVLFIRLSAISSGVKDVREVIEKAKTSGGLFTTKNPILFIDEIHRFSKSQQDSLLQAVEKGWVTLDRSHHRKP